MRNHEHIANITYCPSIIYSLGPETKLGIPTLVARQWEKHKHESFSIADDDISNLIIGSAICWANISKPMVRKGAL